MKLTICDRCGEVFIEHRTQDTIGYNDFDLCTKCREVIISEMVDKRIENYREKLEAKIKEVSNDK